MRFSSDMRPCAVCGQFYPDDPGVLKREVDALLDRVKPKSPGGIVRGIIAPHAGYMYSGYTAAHAYSLLRGKSYDTVVIVSPSHTEYFEGVSVFPGAGYRTPLGPVSMNDRVRDKLLSSSAIVTESRSGHRAEHAVEVHLPFLQQVLGDFTFVPLVVGNQTREVCFLLADALSEALRNENFLLVASTDLSHYYSSEIANRIDRKMIEDVRLFDYERLMTDLETGKAEACGGGPTVSVMSALLRLDVTRMEILHHCNSGDVTGDHRRVVGYLSAAAYA
jgi:AmmeMemoRadiSam system protein B